MAVGDVPGNPPWSTAKTRVPMPRILVSRPRLIHPLNLAATSGRVTLIVAPGGSGKSSLVADWTRQASMPVAWYTVDAADRDIRRLAAGLCGAIARVLPGVADAAFRAIDSGATEVAAIGLLLDRLEDHSITLVLDDFHHLDGLPEATALWEHFFRFRPPTMALTILSRTVPILGFAMLAAMDALLGLGRTDLSFALDEAAELLAKHGLDPAPAAQFVARTDGWATGLLMLARSAPSGVRQLHVSVDTLMDQLGAELLSSLSPDLRTFLLESASLGPVTADEADEIIQHTRSQALFADILQRGLFLTRDGTTYRYHDLFADYFIAVLRAEAPTKLRAIRERASAYWCAQGDLPRALGLLADDGNWRALASLLESQRGALWDQAMWGTAIDMVDRLPESQRTPRVLALSAACHASRGEYALALSRADAGMAAARDESEWLSCAVTHADTLHGEGRLEECSRSAEAALAVARQIGHAAAITRLLSLRGRARLGLGMTEAGMVDMAAALDAHAADRDVDAEAITLYNLALSLTEAGRCTGCDEYFARAAAIWSRKGDMQRLAAVLNLRAIHQWQTGNLRAAEEDARAALSTLGEAGSPLRACEIMATLCIVCAEKSDITEAENLAPRTIELCERVYAVAAANEARRSLIWCALVRRNRSGTRQLIEDARQQPLTPTDSALLDVLEGTLAIRAGAYARAADVLGDAAHRLEGLQRPQYAARALILRAEALLAGGSVSRAEEALNHLATLVLPLGCDGFLRPVTRMTRQVLAERQILRKLRRDTRDLLEQLAAGTPTLTVVTQSRKSESAPPLLRVSPFGPGKLYFDGRTIDATALPPRAREVLCFVTHQKGSAERNTLVETIWEGDVRAAQSLWDASRHIRRLLGERYWTTRGGTYRLNLVVNDDAIQVDADVAAIQGTGTDIEKLAAGERVLELIQPGAFMEWCGSLWATALRAHYGQLALSAALATAALYDRLGRAMEGTSTLRQAIAIDPLDERPREALVRCLSAQGLVQQAVDEYRAYRALVQQELDEEPSPQLRRLVARLGKAIGQDGDPASGPPRRSP